MRSLWLEEVGGAESGAPPLDGDLRTDVCIVGGGYTGLWTALRIRELERALDVVVLEADVCGGGPSGRNGGMVLSWWSKFLALERECGTDEALRLARASEEAVAAVGAFCAEHRIEADYRAGGWLWAATSQPWVGAWRPTLDRLAALGEHPFREIEAAEAVRRTGSPRQLGGVVEGAGATVQPAILADGLRRVALERGVRICEQTPVTALDRDGVCTARGRVRGQRVVLALGPWSTQIRGLARSLVIVSSDMVATPPIPDRLEALGWTDGLSISDARARTEYYRTTRDGRIAFGKGGGALAFGRRIGSAFDGAGSQVRAVEHAFRRVFPALADVPVASAWSGPVDRSRSGLPFFGRLRPSVVYGAGYSGRGVAQSYLGGRILASLALDRRDEWSSCGLVGAPARRFPPEPFRYAGGRVLRSAVSASERAEDEGRPASRLATAVVGLAPSGLLPRPWPTGQDGADSPVTPT